MCFVTFPYSVPVQCGTWLYQFLIVAFPFTFINKKVTFYGSNSRKIIFLNLLNVQHHINAKDKLFVVNDLKLNVHLLNITRHLDILQVGNLMPLLDVLYGMLDSFTAMVQGMG